MKTSCIVVLSLAVCATGTLHASDKKDKEKGMEMHASMEEPIKRGSPGEHHAALEPFAGRFTTTSRMWMNPGEAPQESVGTAEHSWVLGSRFLKMDVRGDMGGQQFEGLGYLGYDNVRGEYTSAWLDNMNTGITRGSGNYDRASKTYKESGAFSCSMTGEKDMRFRAEWKVIDRDTLLYTMYSLAPDGREVKSVEVTYKRRK